MTDMILIEKSIASSHKTSLGLVRISREQSNSSNAIYAFNPFNCALVEIDPSQKWFWNPDWLEGELLVEQELRSGNFDEFDNLEDFIDSL